MKYPKYSPECPVCDSSRTARKGKYKLYGPGYFRFRCNSCRATFTRLVSQELGDCVAIAPEDRPRRSHKGEKNPCAILTERQVRDIVTLKDSGSSIDELSERYGVAGATIISVLSGRSWAHVTGIILVDSDPRKYSSLRRRHR